MAAPELFLLFKYTKKFEYLIAASILILMLFVNTFVFYGYSSMPFCSIIVVIIDIFLILPLIYLLFDNYKDKKHVQLKGGL